MPVMEYGLEDMAGNWVVNMWHKDLAIVDSKVFVESTDDMLYLQDQGFRVVDTESPELESINASVTKEDGKKNESIKAATLIEQ